MTDWVIASEMTNWVVFALIITYIVLPTAGISFLVDYLWHRKKK